MARGRQQFDAEAAFVARTAFVYDGKSYQDGQAFPWRDLGVSRLKLGQLWQARLIDCLPPAATVGATVEAAPIVAPPPVAARHAKHARRAGA